MYLLKISFSRITPANLNASRKKLQAYVGRTQISRALSQRGSKWRWKRCMFFVTGTMNSHFFVTGQIGIKFGKKRQSVCSI